MADETGAGLVNIAQWLSLPLQGSGI